MTASKFTAIHFWSEAYGEERVVCQSPEIALKWLIHFMKAWLDARGQEMKMSPLEAIQYVAENDHDYMGFSVNEVSFEDGAIHLF